jgi:hypothetical protein
MIYRRGGRRMDLTTKKYTSIRTYYYTLSQKRNKGDHVERENGVFAFPLASDHYYQSNVPPACPLSKSFWFAVNNRFRSHAIHFARCHPFRGSVSLVLLVVSRNKFTKQIHFVRLVSLVRPLQLKFVTTALQLTLALKL